MSGTAPPTTSTTTGSGRALYGPPALRIFTQTHDPQPGHTTIAQERFAQRFNIRFDNDDDHESRGFGLHPHFCTSSQDRGFAFQEAMGDIEDAAIGAARTADTLFLGFGIRPEWPPSRPLQATDIDVRVVATRQFEQSPALRAALDKIRQIVQEEIAVPHILAFHDKLEAFTPGAGYAFDAATRRIITQPVQLAANTISRLATDPQDPAIQGSPPAVPAAANTVATPQSPSLAQSTIGTAAHRNRAAGQSIRAPQSVARGLSITGRGTSGASGARDAEPSLLLRLAMDLGIPTTETPSRAEVEEYYGFPRTEDVVATSPTTRRNMRMARTAAYRGAETSADDWIRTPNTPPPPLPPSSSSLHADPPPPYTRAPEPQDYGAHYAAATVESFGFSAIVSGFLRRVHANARQCTQITLALDFHVADWEALFQDKAELSREHAHTLRQLIFREASQQLRDVMEAARPLIESGSDGEDEDEDAVSNLSSHLLETLSSISTDEDSV